MKKEPSKKNFLKKDRYFEVGSSIDINVSVF